MSAIVAGGDNLLVLPTHHIYPHTATQWALQVFSFVLNIELEQNVAVFTFTMDSQFGDLHLLF